jgi:hypothetical protein
MKDNITQVVGGVLLQTCPGLPSGDYFPASIFQVLLAKSLPIGIMAAKFCNTAVRQQN